MFRETLVTSDLFSACTSATGRQPHDIRVSHRYPRPRTYTRRPFDLCHEGRYVVVQQVVVWFDYFYPDTPRRLWWFSLYSLHTKTVCPVAYPPSPSNQLKKKESRDASTCLGATQVGVTQVVSVRLASVQGFLRLVG